MQDTQSVQQWFLSNFTDSCSTPVLLTVCQTHQSFENLPQSLTHLSEVIIPYQIDRNQLSTSNMPTFSDLPIELVGITWGFVDESEDIESFALVSKKVSSLSTPVLQEHARLRNLRPTVDIDIDKHPSGPYEMLERLLHHPRLAFYIHEAHIEDWRLPQIRPNVSLASLSPERIAAFEDAVHCSLYIPPSEKEGWVRRIKRGNPDPIVALIIMRLTKLRKLRLVYPYTGGNDYLHDTLKWMTLVPDGANSLGSSVTHLGPDSGSQVGFKRPSPFRNIRDIELNRGDMEMNVLCKMLQGVKGLEKFAITSSPGDIVDFPRLKRELLRCSRASLYQLVLYDDDSQNQSYIGRLVGFENLVELNVSVSFLLGDPDEEDRRLVDVLPMSIEKLSIYLGNEAEPDKVEDLVNQVVECKIACCPRLDTFWVETMNLIEMDDEEESLLKEKLADVGVEFDMGEYSNF